VSDSPPLGIALAGIGKIARDQHAPTLADRQDAKLVATISRRGRIEGIPGFQSIAEAVDQASEIGAVVICTPPRLHFDQAQEALRAGRHVFLEKPPVSSLAEMEMLRNLAAKARRTLFASWHSRFAGAIEPAKRWIAGKQITSVSIRWLEDVRRWHPGQDWIFEPGGMGVFDPGINALSIATRILPRPFALKSAMLDVPVNRQTPIAASLVFADESGVPITAEFDFRASGAEVWEIAVDAEEGTLLLFAGGARLKVDGLELPVEPASEYARLYDHFMSLVNEGMSDTDVTPLSHVADAFLMAERRDVDAFEW